MPLYNSYDLDYAVPAKLNRQYSDCMTNMILNECDINYEFDITLMVCKSQYAFVFLCDIHIYNVLFTELRLTPCTPSQV